MQSARNLLRQGKYFTFFAVIVLADVAIFLSLLLLLGMFSGGLRCDTYATKTLTEWISFVDERCKAP